MFLLGFNPFLYGSKLLFLQAFHFYSENKYRFHSFKQSKSLICCCLFFNRAWISQVLSQRKRFLRPYHIAYFPFLRGCDSHTLCVECHNKLVNAASRSIFRTLFSICDEGWLARVGYFCIKFNTFLASLVLEAVNGRCFSK